jgi:hypothetical protein
VIHAEVAHLVEHDLAKVGVAGSSPVFRSLILLLCRRRIFFGSRSSKVSQVPGVMWLHRKQLLELLNSGNFWNFHSPGGETGRHAGLKILWAARPVRVQLPPGAQSDLRIAFFMPLYSVRCKTSEILLNYVFEFLFVTPILQP